MQVKYSFIVSPFVLHRLQSFYCQYCLGYKEHSLQIRLKPMVDVRIQESPLSFRPGPLICCTVLIDPLE